MESETSTGTEAPEQAPAASPGTDESTETPLLDTIGSMLAEVRGDTFEQDDPEVEATEEVEEEGFDAPEEPAAEAAPEVSDEVQTLREQNALLMERLDSVLARLDAKEQEQPAAPAPKPKAEKPPEGASAEEIIEFYAEQKAEQIVQRMLDEKLKPIAPTLEQREFEDGLGAVFDEMRQAGDLDPVFSKPGPAGVLGTVLEKDPELLDLAKTDPRRALRFAQREALKALADAKKEDAAAKKQTTKPLPRRTTQGNRSPMENPLEVARRELRRMRAGS
jgi:hypothetical protein